MKVQPYHLNMSVVIVRSKLVSLWKCVSNFLVNFPECCFFCNFLDVVLLETLYFDGMDVLHFGRAWGWDGPGLIRLCLTIGVIHLCISKYICKE